MILLWNEARPNLYYVYIYIGQDLFASHLGSERLVGSVGNQQIVLLQALICRLRRLAPVL